MACINCRANDAKAAADAKVSRLLDDAYDLLADMREIGWHEEVRRAEEARQAKRQQGKFAKVRQLSFAEALKQELGNAAQGSLHDKIGGKHRPGGKALPRPRWSIDEPPLGGWDNGEHRIEVAEVRQPKPETDDFAGLMAKLEQLVPAQSDAEPADDFAGFFQQLAEIEQPEQDDIDYEALAAIGIHMKRPKLTRKQKKLAHLKRLSQPQEQPRQQCRRTLPWATTRRVKAVLRCSNPKASEVR